MICEVNEYRPLSKHRVSMVAITGGQVLKPEDQVA